MFCQPTYVHSLPSPPTTPEPLGYRNAGANAAPYHHPVQYNEFGVRSPFAAPRAPPSPPPTLPIPPEARLGTFIGAGRLRFDRIIGSGAYGTVYLAVDVTTGKQVAVKTLNKYNDDGSLKDQLNASYQAREIRLHFDASAHPNVVSILNIIETPDCIHVVLEYCPDGDLFYNIVVLGRYEGDDALVRRSFLQILEAVMFCHSLGIYHRDLKPENILVTDQGNTIKLADFGLASNLPHSADYGCGSEFYMSPGKLELAELRTQPNPIDSALPWCFLFPSSLTDISLYRVPGPLVSQDFLPLCPQRCVEPWSHSGEPHLPSQPMEACLARGCQLPGLHVQPRVPEDHSSHFR